MSAVSQASLEGLKTDQMFHLSFVSELHITVPSHHVDEAKRRDGFSFLLTFSKASLSRTPHPRSRRSAWLCYIGLFIVTKQFRYFKMSRETFRPKRNESKEKPDEMRRSLAGSFVPIPWQSLSSQSQSRVAMSLCLWAGRWPHVRSLPRHLIFSETPTRVQ